MKVIFKNVKYLDENGDIKFGNFLIVENGYIKGFFDNIEYSRRKVIDCKGKILLPAFVNSHFHLGETIYKGLFKLDNLENYIKNTEKIAKSLTDLDYKKISKYSLKNLLENGVITFQAARNFDLVEKSKMRGCLGYPIMKSDKLKRYYEGLEMNITNLLEKDYKNINIGLWIHSLNFLDNLEILKKLNEIKEKYNLFLTIHISETKNQVFEIQSKYKKTEVEILDEYNLLGEKTNLVHCNYLTKNDLELIERTKTNITICPLSNFYLNGELCNKEYLKYNINISIGTDGIATGLSFSLLENLKFFYFTNKNSFLKNNLLNYITYNGAVSLGNNKLGKIKEGFLADLLFIEDKNYISFYEILLDEILVKDVFSENNFLIYNGKNLIFDKKVESDFGNLKKSLVKNIF